jgi:hypothetical protein
MKSNINLQIKKLSIEIGWFSGEDFCLFRVEVGRNWGFAISILSIQILKFAFNLTWG